tara:strand:+ start:19785 stop:20696 length:912 start_codon:yes stop_codon:yes gene_type:complete
MYFYLEWIDRRPKLPVLVDKEPDVINYSEKVKIDKKEIIICGNINTKFTKYYPPKKNEYSKYQYLQSHLQKAVRRMEDVKSIQTAKHLLDLNLTAFLRRLPIIMLEDVTIHESFSIIIWLMIAVSKGYALRYEMVKWLLGVVYYLSLEDEKTYYCNNDRDKMVIDTQNKYKDLLYSLRFRKEYGGMEGDMNMIEYYIHMIHKGEIKIKTEKIQLIQINEKKLILNKKDWIYQANDFHCNKFILRQIKNYHTNYSEEYIQKLIWYFSSSINKRIIHIEYPDKDKNNWDKIQKVVQYIQKKCIFY